MNWQIGQPMVALKDLGNLAQPIESKLWISPFIFKEVVPLFTWHFCAFEMQLHRNNFKDINNICNKKYE